MDLGLTQRTLAARWGLKVRTLASWESGERRPSITQGPRILELLADDPEAGHGGLVARLEAARRRLGATQREFAAIIGVDEGTIGRWLAGRRWPRAETARELEAALELLQPSGQESKPVDDE